MVFLEAVSVRIGWNYCFLYGSACTCFHYGGIILFPCFCTDYFRKKLTGSLERTDERRKIIEDENDTTESDFPDDSIIYRNDHDKKHHKVDHEILHSIDVSGLFFNFVAFLLKLLTSARELRFHSGIQTVHSDDPKSREHLLQVVCVLIIKSTALLIELLDGF